MQYGPPMDSFVSTRHTEPVITLSQSDHVAVDLYKVGDNCGSSIAPRPFIHKVKLQGNKGDCLYIKGLFDNGAMVNAICSFLYRKFAGVLGHLQPSTKVLRMANGSHVKSHGQWIGRVGLGGRTMHATFEVFPSGKGWSLLFGKPLLQDFEAVQDYKRDTLHIQHGNSWTTLSNQCGEIESSEEDSGGAETPPSRQVQPTSRTREPVNKQTSFTLYVPAEERKQHNVARHRANVVSGLGLSWRRELRDTAYEDELSERSDA